jgi:hypothetical protein
MKFGKMERQAKGGLLQNRSEKNGLAQRDFMSFQSFKDLDEEEVFI